MYFCMHEVKTRNATNTPMQEGYDMNYLATAVSALTSANKTKVIHAHGVDSHNTIM